VIVQAKTPPSRALLSARNAKRQCPAACGTAAPLDGPVKARAAGSAGVESGEPSLGLVPAPALLLYNQSVSDDKKAREGI
jgi:hypothetical protein